MTEIAVRDIPDGGWEAMTVWIVMTAVDERNDCVAGVYLTQEAADAHFRVEGGYTPEQFLVRSAYIPRTPGGSDG